jgi:tripartite-type tricarboxylate transporter receptor subunit TctC
MSAAVVVAGATHGETAREAYPNRPVRMIVPFGAGGPGDIFARLIAQQLSGRLGQQYFIENRPGAGGTIGAGLAARAPADGYTLLVGSSTVWVNASLYPQMPYDPIKNFDPIIIAAISPEVLVVHPSVPARNVQELVALVRAGKYSNFAIPGAGTPPHLSTELFKLSLKLDFVTVPFAGGGPMVQSVIAGHTPVAFSALPAASTQIRDGLIRALAVTSAKRVSLLPDVPTMEEGPACRVRSRRRHRVCGRRRARLAKLSICCTARSRRQSGLRR